MRQGYSHPEFPQNSERGLSAIIKGLYFSAIILVPHGRNKRARTRHLSKLKVSSQPAEVSSFSTPCPGCWLFHCLSLTFWLLVYIEQTDLPSSAVNRVILVEGDCFLPYPPNNDSIPVKADRDAPRSRPLLGPLCNVT